MFHIKIEEILKKDIDAVFNMLAAHGNYGNFRGVKDAQLLEEGVSEKNGEGALRYIDLGMVRFEERIVKFERPFRIDYLIEKTSPLPFEHDLGSICLSECAEGTKVTWTSIGRVSVPLLGRLFLDRKFETQAARGFRSVLKQIETAEMEVQ
ncbi:SRPBCC family protein [Temperatibacter marinus]|uniref:SRPBCC family protein n=1 Tax=Temperatibacter marinus TaxID=1456591 RepID=A0AA52EH05_9PROT|nr:SRPBCC family protein [Temperatibacter marinus]WND02988.1 SRPBCC family protein [Temperatibacter marinus]